MAPLPDIDTTQVSYLAYWNALNQGAGSISPSEVTSAGNIVDTTIYDNGVELTVSVNGARNGKARVKQDGWFVAYLNQDEEHGRERINEPFNGPWDILPYVQDPPAGQQGFDSAPNELASVIQTLQGQLSNSGQITFDPDDVGLYNYEHQQATGVSQFSHECHRFSTAGSSFSFTESTDVYMNDLIAATEVSFEDGNVQTQFDGVNVLNLNIDEESAYSAVDLTTEFSLDPATEYSVNGDAGSFGFITNTIHALWG